MQTITDKQYTARGEAHLRRLAVAMTLMYAWIMIWALVLKLGIENEIVTNYLKLKHLNATERIMWDLIPFYRLFEGYDTAQRVLQTVLNCFVFVPFGIAFCYIFKKKNIWRDAALCLGFAMLIEFLQLITRFGNPATEDLITNVAGYFIGLGIYNLIFKRLSVEQSTKIFTTANIVCAAAVAVSLVTTVDAADSIYKILTRTL